MVRLFILGSGPATSWTARSGRSSTATPSVVERAIVTLASDRGLLLIGDPGTGKSWLAELLAAAVCGNSTHVVQGTAGTTEDQIKYSWNVAMVIAAGQSRDSMIPSPIMTAMQKGEMGRFEELTRCTSDVQDALISILSEKYVSIPELSTATASSSPSPASTSSPPPTAATAASTTCPPRSSAASTSCRSPSSPTRRPRRRSSCSAPRSCWAATASRWRCRRRCWTSCCRRSPTCARRRPRRPPRTSSWSRRCPRPSRSACWRTRCCTASSSANAADARTLARSLVGTLVRRIPEDVSILNNSGTASSRSAARSEGGVLAGFLQGGKDAMADPDMSGSTTGPSPRCASNCSRPPRRSRDRPRRAGGILLGMVDDVGRAAREPLEIFPVCHHSPASAVAMAAPSARAAAAGDLHGAVRGPAAAADRAAQLPAAGRPPGVRAVESTASPPSGRRSAWSRPITEFSAEYQAIAFALDNPTTSWSSSTAPSTTCSSGMPRTTTPGTSTRTTRTTPPADDAGRGRPARLRRRRADRRLAAELRRAGGAPAEQRPGAALRRVVGPVRRAAARRRDYDTYRQVMFLVGSLLRRLAAGEPDRVRTDEPASASCGPGCAAPGRDRRRSRGRLYICGAVHAASDVEEFGMPRSAPARSARAPRTSGCTA